MRTCEDCNGSMEGRNWRCTFCAPCAKARFTKRNRARAAAWYIANTDRAIARSRARRLANLEGYRLYNKLYRRTRMRVKICASVGCGKPVDTIARLLKFCAGCSEFYKTTDTHRNRRTGRAA